MKVSTLLQRTKQHVDMIATDEAADSRMREKALNDLAKYIDEQKRIMLKRVEEQSLTESNSKEG